jgi:hypothetical protein
MDLLMLLVVYLLSRIIENWPAPWQTRVLLLVLLLILVILGFFGAPAFWPHGGRLR